MPSTTIRVVDVYPYRLTPDRDGTDWHVELLLLRRAPGTSYSGTWRMVGGSIDSGESAWETARRELKEETGLEPLEFWTLPSVNTFYEWHADRISLTPAFAARVDGSITLNAEHDTYDWLAPDAACERLHWPEQRRLARLTADIAHSGAIPPSLRIDGLQHSARQA